MADTAVMSPWQAIPNVRDNTPWHKDKGRMKLNFFLSIIFAGMFLNGYDGNLISGLQAFDSWQEDLDFPTGARLGLLNAIGYISGFFVGPVIVYIDDNFGRKWGIRFYGIMILIGTVIGCIAGIPGVNGYAVFLVGRAVLGLGLAAYLMTSQVMIQEIPHPRSRSIVAQSWNSYYILGSVVASWVNFGCSYLTTSWQWRTPYIIQVPFALYLLVAVQFVPETPRFLIGKGRDEEALQFFIDYHGNGDAQDPLVLFEYAEVKEAIRREKEAKAEKWSTILRSRPNRHRLGLAMLITFCTNMSGSSLIYFYYVIVFSSVGITDATTQTGIAAGLSMFTWVCQIAAVFASKRVGRKTMLLWVWPFILIFLSCLCATSGVYTESGNENMAASTASIVFVWLYLGTFNLSNPVLYSYPAEIQTFSMRSKGMLVWNAITQIEYVYVVFVDAIALEAIGYRYYAVYIPLVVIQWFLLKFFMVETRGYTLEEVAMAFDPYTTSFADVHLMSEEQGETAAHNSKARDVEDQK
ncbi:general substrate transporter [Dioszegia hungarica]|uniref:General substrate transporter n=1 Tax=Dioszegia hungarica TaxID=4972 RepID=A0AA38LSC5_9TREE|nr:general substrate transporter [Dioszegia hungarica]KAI9632414.1 general substrate transporter [Dioszegia hungarica]